MKYTKLGGKSFLEKQMNDTYKEVVQLLETLNLNKSK